MQNIEERFDEIQAGLGPLWEKLRNPRVPRLCVAVPSLSLDLEGLPMPGGLLHFEERMLYMFHLLSQPSCHLRLYTSHLIPEQEIDYYLHFLRHVPFTHARNRLRMVALMDREVKPLTQKMLDRPALLERLRREIQKGPPAYLSVYHSSRLEMELAVELGIPIMGTDPRLEPLSTKQSARALFQDVGAPVVEGVSGLSGLEDLARALMRMHGDGTLTLQRPQVVVKQNRGVSGLGNRKLSILPFWNLLVSDLEDGEKAARLAQSLRRQPGSGPYWDRFERLGGLVECWFDGEPVSVQLSLSPAGIEVEGICEEMLAPDGQYLGAILPASDRLTNAVLQQARRCGEALAGKGVLGRVEIDFLVGSEGTHALDVNFRKSNTQAALRQLTALAGGGYRVEENRYLDGAGASRTMFTTDWLAVGPDACSIQDVIEIVTEQALHYSLASHTGVIFHMLGGVGPAGRVGISCIGADLLEAQDLHMRTAASLGSPLMSGASL